MPLTGKDYKKKYTGMKKAPIAVLKVAVRANILKKKAEKYVERRKVRSSETIEMWAGRMRRYNLMKEENIQRKLSQLKIKYKIQVRENLRAKAERKKGNETVTVFFGVKDFDYLQYYGIVKQYYSIKYAISKVDLEICFTFFNNKIIDLDSFYNICILNHGHANGFLKRFKDLGYLEELINNSEFEKKDKTSKPTGVYRLSSSMIKLITNFYKIISKLQKISKNSYRGMYPKGVEVEILKMNQEIEDYLTMNKSQLSIADAKNITD